MLENIKEKLYINVSQKYISTIWVALQGFVFLITGILIFNITSKFLTVITYAISIFFLIIGIAGMLQTIFSGHKKVKYINIFNNIINIFIGTLFIYKPEIFMSLFPLLFTLYIFIDAIIKTITCFIYMENKLKKRYMLLLRTVLTYVFLGILIFYPMFRIKLTYIIVGIYFVSLAVTYFFDAIELLTPRTQKNKIKKRIKIVLPVYIAAFIPKKVLKEINKMLEIKNKYDKYIIKKEEKIQPNFEILIHIKEGKTGSFGHVDIYMDDKVISFGSYDEESVKLLSSIGSGVLFEVDKEKYIKFCNRNENKNIISFGLKITEKQKNIIRKKLEDIKQDAYEWRPLSQIYDSGRYTDYASRLYNATEAKFYKFRRGKYKTYFVLNSNCVLLADELLDSSGLDLLSINGLITPGTYYDYFNREFRRKKSIVVSKEIYLNKTKAVIKK